MKKTLLLILTILTGSCGLNEPAKTERIISVSIAPFEYFVKTIGAGDFQVNVMVPAGASPHIYEPSPGQINMLRKSSAYVSNGFLGFEMSWLPKFYDVNKTMEKLSLGDYINLIEAEHAHEGEHAEKADPHFWVSPKNASVIALKIKDLLCRLNPGEAEKYGANYDSLVIKIKDLERKAEDLFADHKGNIFITYHPTLAYLARDYGLEELTLEHDGKEPSPARVKELIDIARSNNIKKVFLTREYDKRQVEALSSETGAEIVVIDPLSPDWFQSVQLIIMELHESFIQSPEK
ncbi:MAG TPA: zinc ABC transporter substrate-binding protein [Bacteroidales bacterium]|nr:zinc ABC transporter substrate-binding protein [Bacteroidales bacterium]HRW84319.1 zinc ABC transporter substrate-binding protein [Bacteroidales bacterium]